MRPDDGTPGPPRTCAIRSAGRRPPAAPAGVCAAPLAPGAPSRRGSVYIAVLGTSMIVAVIGLTAIALVNARLRASEGAGGLDQARCLAQAAIEFGMLATKELATWRTTYPNGTWASNVALAGGTYTLVGQDPTDADLADSPFDPLLLTGTGTSGNARYMLRVQLQPTLSALEALRTCIHTAGQIQVKNNKTFTVTGAPLSTNGNLRNDGTVQGDVEAASLSGDGDSTITGRVTIPAPSKPLPDPSVFDTYRVLATPIAYPGNIDQRVLSPGSNPWGATNPDGLYYIDTGGSDLTIQDSRIHGTLVVQTRGKRVILDDTVLLQNYRPDYPVLIVDGDIELIYSSVGTPLSEADQGVNFNPPGSPYLGTSDLDTTDIYPSEVQGLVHVRGTILMDQSALVRGTVIGESTALINSNVQIIHNPTLYTNPPMGYTNAGPLYVTPGSWQRVVTP